MRLKELESKFANRKLTSIQKEIEYKTLIGAVTEISGKIGDIRENTIMFLEFSPDFRKENIFNSDDLIFTFYYEKETFGRQLLALMPRDEVKITAKIKDINLSGYNYTCCDFELTSIVKINTYEEIEKARKEAEQKQQSSCFIATACFGNYNSPEVLVLQQFRDEKLLKTFFGKVFVRFYYSVSPFFARLISKSELLKKSVRQYFLEPIVTKLQRQNKSK